MAATRRHRRSLRLRTRVTLYFGLAAFVATMALAFVTYALSRSFLIDQRTSVARTQAFANAKTVNDQLVADASIVGAIMPALRTEGGGFAQLTVPPGQSYVSDFRFPVDAVPTELIAAVTARRSGDQFFAIDGEPYLAVGVYLASSNSQYYEAFPLSGTDKTLRTIATAMGVGTLITTIIAGAVGWWISRRLLRPLTRVAAAASELASGGLDTRLTSESDPDLARLADSFNEMADAVQTRLEREARFASDVSHELRSPITALGAAVEVLDSRRGDLPDRSKQALDVVVTQVRRFDQMVMDLLELSRLDAGSAPLHPEEIPIDELIGRIAQRYGFGHVPIAIANDVPEVVTIDKLRFERILANLLDNAREHAGGPTSVSVERLGKHAIVLAVTDAGPGVARGERSRIFERFARGSAARHRVGTGLGLALVAEHAQAMSGEAWVEDRAGGGSIFKVSLGNAI